MTSMLYVRN